MLYGVHSASRVPSFTFSPFRDPLGPRRTVIWYFSRSRMVLVEQDQIAVPVSIATGAFRGSPRLRSLELDAVRRLDWWNSARSITGRAMPPMWNVRSSTAFRLPDGSRGDDPHRLSDRDHLPARQVAAVTEGAHPALALAV